MKNYILYSVVNPGVNESSTMLQRFDTLEDAIQKALKYIEDWRNSGGRKNKAYKICYNGRESVEMWRGCS